MLAQRTPAIEMKKQVHYFADMRSVLSETNLFSTNFPSPD